MLFAFKAQAHGYRNVTCVANETMEPLETIE